MKEYLQKLKAQVRLVNKKLIIIMCLLSLSLFGKQGNAVLKYVSSSSYAEGAEKFNGKKDIFKETVDDKAKIDNELAIIESRLKSVFTTTLTVIQIGNNWNAVVYYNDPTFGQKRLVITGETSLKVDGYTYRLTPLADGVSIKDVRSGNIYKLEVKGR